MLSKSLLRVIAISAVIILFLLAPVWARTPYLMHIVIMVYFNIILALGFFLVHTTGQYNFCQATFFGIGAYTSTLLVMRLGFSFWLALPLASMVGGLVAIALGYPFLRVKGVYFFLITLAFGEFMRLLWLGNTALFGGHSGISHIPPRILLLSPGYYK